MSRHATLPFFRLRIGLLASVLLASLALPLSTRAASTTVRDELNLRNGPGAGYAILAVMPAGSTVALNGEATEGWYPVIYNNLGGWAYGAYLALAGNGGTGGDVQAYGGATVITAVLNLRSGPGFGYGIIAGLTYGTTVEIVGGPQAGDGQSWLQVRASRVGLGWVAREYIDAGEAAGGSAASPPPPPAAAPPPRPLPTVPPPPPPAPTPAPARSGDPIVNIITDAANRYGQSPAAMLAVARCESGLNPNAVNRSSGASGLFQFLPGTWRTTPYASSSILDPWANANAAAWMWSVGRRGEWVC